MDHAIDRQDADRPVEVRKVEPGRPLVWLQRGWADFRKAAAPSLIYGGWAAAFGFALLMVAWRSTYLAPALVGGFLLVAPFVAIVFYALSQQIEQGRPVDGAEAVFAWRRNSGIDRALGTRADAGPDRLGATGGHSLRSVLRRRGQRPDVADVGHPALRPIFALLFVYFAVGGIFALTVFVFGIVTAPMLLDRDVDVVTAALTSLRACLANPGATLVWAVLIALLTAIGFATLMLGMVIVFPLLGHASWHAYRDLVK